MDCNGKLSDPVQHGKTSYYIRLWLVSKTMTFLYTLKDIVTYLRQNCITNRFDAANILRKIYNKNSNVECELIAYALNNIVHNALHD